MEQPWRSIMQPANDRCWGDAAFRSNRANGRGGAMAVTELILLSAPTNWSSIANMVRTLPDEC
jgi:predicted outer membrane repeat protein